MCRRLSEEPPPGYHPVRLPRHGWVVILLDQVVTDEHGVLYVPCMSSMPDRKTGQVHVRMFRGPSDAIRAAKTLYTSQLERLVQRLQGQVAEPQPV